MTCAACRGCGWVLVVSEHNAAKPCQRCNLDQFNRWSAGEYAPRIFTRSPTPEAQAEDVHTAIESCRQLLDRVSTNR